MDKLFEILFEQGGLVRLVLFVVPGFVAWAFYKARRPKSEHKATDAVVEILCFSVMTDLIWFSKHWSDWPTTWADALLFVVEIFLTPLLVALVFQFIVDFAATMGWISSPHPRAWDYLFNDLALDPKGPARNGLFLVLTLKDGSKVAGLYGSPAYVSLFPYDRDIFLGQVWELENETKPARRVQGSIGVYVDCRDIRTIEAMDYAAVLRAALKETESR